MPEPIAIRIESQFNATAYEKAIRDHKSSSSKPLYDQIKRVLFVGSLLVLVGSTILNTPDQVASIIGCFMVGLGGHYLLSCLRFYRQMRKWSTDQDAFIRTAIQRMSGYEKPIIFEFTEAHLLYEDIDCNFRLNWKLLKGYKVVNNNLFLNTDVQNGQQYVFPGIYASAEEWSSILELVERKMKESIEL